MAVMITDTCINCDACIEECPAEAIVSADESPLANGEFTYVKPEKCIECVDCTIPKCVDACPTDGCIVWDMPYTSDYNDYYVKGHEDGVYSIRVHKKKGMFTPELSPKPFRESVSIEDREAHKAIES